MAAFTRTPTSGANARTTPARRSVSPFTVDDLATVYGADWRFDRSPSEALRFVGRR